MESNEIIEKVNQDLKSRGLESPPEVVEEFVRKYLLLNEVGHPAAEIDSENMQRQVDIWEILTRNRPPQETRPATFRELIDGLSKEDREDLLSVLDGRTLAEALGLFDPLRK